MSDKAEALRLADALLADLRKPTWDVLEATAAELRRLLEENERLTMQRDEARRTVREAHEAGTLVTAQRDALLEALRDALELIETISPIEGHVVRAARAAIAAVEGEMK